MGRSISVPLRGVCDVVAFVSEPDSMISPSEGDDGDLDLRDSMVPETRSVVAKRNEELIFVNRPLEKLQR